MTEELEAIYAPDAEQLIISAGREERLRVVDGGAADGGGEDGGGAEVAGAGGRLVSGGEQGGTHAGSRRRM